MSCLQILSEDLMVSASCGSNRGEGSFQKPGRMEECEDDEQCVVDSLRAFTPPPGTQPRASDVPAAFSIHQVTLKMHKPLCLFLFCC